MEFYKSPGSNNLCIGSPPYYSKMSQLGFLQVYNGTQILLCIDKGKQMNTTLMYNIIMPY